MTVTVGLGGQAMEWGRAHPRAVCISMAYVGRAWLLYACLIMHGVMKAMLAATLVYVQGAIPTFLVPWELTRQLVCMLISPNDRLIVFLGMAAPR